MDFLNFIKIILCSLPIVLLCFANYKIRLHKTNRGKQVVMPVLALVYGIVVVILADKIDSLLFSLMDYLGMGTILRPYLIYIFNVVIVLGFMVIKAIFLPIVAKIWSSKSLMKATSGYFYTYDEKVDKWFLEKRFGNFRGYYKGFFIGFFIVSVVVFTLSQHFTSSAAFQAVFYPTFGIILFGEIVNFLSGITKTEFVEDILGEDEDSFRVCNYGALRGILSDLYGDRVLYENTADATDGISTTFDALDEMQKSDDRQLSLIGRYFADLKESGKDININYVKSCINLLNGKSTLFVNPFYRDLTEYITLPLIRQLISYRKCLVVVGRDSSVEDVKNWIEETVYDTTNTGALWKTRILNEDFGDTDIGIVRFCDIYNMKLHQANHDFLSKIGFVLLIEPSRILSSGQIGLNLLVSQSQYPADEIVYCACDRNCDGLVDALSHTLKTSITEVTATLNGAMNCSHMYWNADGEYMHHKILPNVSRYLGMGTDINAVAIKHQINDTMWFGSEKFPVIDMKWIAGQYYKPICNYADIPASQSEFDRVFTVSANLWNCESKDNAFVVVEDEFQNLFEISRVFASRGKQQNFVNVISENYYLRDYMIDNVDTFISDPKAIPTIVPDYARTERNVVLKLIMMMVNAPVSDTVIEKELMLCGISFEDSYTKLKELIYKHCKVEDPSLTVRFKEEVSEDSLSTRVVKQYSINNTNELYTYAQLLKNAYFLAEDEEGEKHYIGAKLYGHIFQAFLPGQFMTFNGKYYEIQTVTPLNGVVVRRSADHITNRRYYRQVRDIELYNWTQGDSMGSAKTIYDLEITNGYADIKVTTGGYYEMKSYGDIKRAKKITINGIPERNYRNKNVLRIRFPNSTDKVRYTICLILNEIFRTVYPESYPYISVVTNKPTEDVSYCTDLLYGLSGEVEDDCVYVIEDSEIDLGLLVSVERNLKRFLEIVTETLMWHTEKAGAAVEPDEPTDDFVPVFDKPKDDERKKFGEKISDLIKKIFGKKKAEETEPEVDSQEAPQTEPAEESVETETEFTVEPDGNEVSVSTGDTSESSESGEETETDKEVVTAFDTAPAPEFGGMDEQFDIEGEDEELVNPEDENAYMKKCFLKFGYSSISPWLDITETIKYLSSYNFHKNPLHQVRTKAQEAKEYGETYDPKKHGVHMCDFCGVELSVGGYDVLKDGRERCNRCSLTAVRTGEEFKEIFKSVMRNMEVFYGINLNVAVKVRMTDAKKIAKHVGEEFVATPGFDARTLGFARKDRTGYSIYVESGSPKLAAIATIAHEITHIWQYTNWNEKELIAQYGKENLLEVYEGMAKWAEIQYLILLNEVSYAKRQEICTMMRDDEYGKGFIKYVTKYPLSYGTKTTKTPFDQFPPLGIMEDNS